VRCSPGYATDHCAPDYSVRQRAESLGELAVWHVVLAVIIVTCAMSPLLWIAFGARNIRLGWRAVVQFLSLIAFIPWYGLFLTICPALALCLDRPKLRIGRSIFILATLFLIGLPFYLGTAFVVTRPVDWSHKRDAIAGALFVWAIITLIGQFSYLLWMPLFYFRLNHAQNSKLWMFLAGISPTLFWGELVIFNPRVPVVGISWLVLLAILLVGSRSLGRSAPSAPNPVPALVVEQSHDEMNRRMGATAAAQRLDVAPGRSPDSINDDKELPC
jgi:hypothetical protein